MSLHPTAEKHAKTILARLPRAGPSTLQEIYGFCGALDGGAQHFVRQAVSQLAADCKIRRISQGIYAASADAAPHVEAAVDPPEPESDAAEQAKEPAADTAPVDGNDHRPVANIEEPPAVAATAERQPTEQEQDQMQTQTTSRKQRTTRNGKNGHAAKPAARTGSKVDWIVAVVGETGTARFGDIFARARKEDVFKEAKNLGAALCGAVKQKRLKKIERGIYAVPGAKVVFDADKAKKKPVSAKANKPAPAKKPAKKVTAAVAAKPAVKPGRKPSIFRSVYDELDLKIAKAKTDEKAATAGIGDVDAQIESLKTKRVELAAKRDAARATGKKLDDSRKRIAEVESGVAESLKA